MFILRLPHPCLRLWKLQFCNKKRVTVLSWSSRLLCFRTISPWVQSLSRSGATGGWPLSIPELIHLESPPSRAAKAPFSLFWLALFGCKPSCSLTGHHSGTCSSELPSPLVFLTHCLEIKSPYSKTDNISQCLSATPIPCHLHGNKGLIFCSGFMKNKNHMLLDE